MEQYRRVIHFSHKKLKVKKLCNILKVEMLILYSFRQKTFTSLPKFTYLDYLLISLYRAFLSAKI